MTKPMLDYINRNPKTWESETDWSASWIGVQMRRIAGKRDGKSTYVGENEDQEGTIRLSNRNKTSGVSWLNFVEPEYEAEDGRKSQRKRRRPKRRRDNCRGEDSDDDSEEDGTFRAPKTVTKALAPRHLATRSKSADATVMQHPKNIYSSSELIKWIKKEERTNAKIISKKSDQGGRIKVSINDSSIKPCFKENACFDYLHESTRTEKVPPPIYYVSKEDKHVRLRVDRHNNPNWLKVLLSCAKQPAFVAGEYSFGGKSVTGVSGNLGGSGKRRSVVKDGVLTIQRGDSPAVSPAHRGTVFNGNSLSSTRKPGPAAVATAGRAMQPLCTRKPTSGGHGGDVGLNKESRAEGVANSAATDKHHQHALHHLSDDDSDGTTPPQSSERSIGRKDKDGRGGGDGAVDSRAVKRVRLDEVDMERFIELREKYAKLEKALEISEEEKADCARALKAVEKNAQATGKHNAETIYRLERKVTDLQDESASLAAEVQKFKAAEALTESCKQKLGRLFRWQFLEVPHEHKLFLLQKFVQSFDLPDSLKCLKTLNYCKSTVHVRLSEPPADKKPKKKKGKKIWRCLKTGEILKSWMQTRRVQDNPAQSSQSNNSVNVPETSSDAKKKAFDKRVEYCKFIIYLLSHLLPSTYVFDIGITHHNDDPVERLKSKPGNHVKRFGANLDVQMWAMIHLPNRGYCHNVEVILQRTYKIIDEKRFINENAGPGKGIEYEKEQHYLYVAFFEPTKKNWRLSIGGGL